MPDEPTGALTFLFSDIEGSTRLLTRLGDDYTSVHDDHQRLLRTAWQEHGGREVSTEGDSFFVVFGSPSDALRAASDAHRSLADESWPQGAEVKVRIGIHAGNAIRVGDNFLGLDVNRAARIAAAGHGGQTLLSEATIAGLPDDVRITDLGRHRLKDVGVEHLWQHDVDGLPTSFGRLRSLEEHPTNLPGETSTLIGREAEVADIAARLAEARVVTVTGPGGIGKSRVAIAVARRQLDTFPDGAFYVDVASIDTADRAADRLLEVLELPSDPTRRSSDAVLELLRGRSVLVVLDNGDRVSDLADLVSTIARACDRVRLLVTSRSPLHVRGEREVSIGPLAGANAVDLFTARAREVRPGLSLAETTSPIVGEICARLDGLPLAIELAAARTRILSLEALRARLARRLPLLAGGDRDAPDRQRTMRDAIAWSYDFLEPPERELLDRLAVFEGEFDLAAVDAVAGGEDVDVVGLLEALVERSLIAHADQSEGTFRLLGTIREFALEMLEGGGSGQETRARHLQYLIDFVSSEIQRTDIDDVATGARIERYEADVAAALRRALPASGPADPEQAATALRLATAIGRHWWLHGHLRDGAASLERALQATADRPLPETAMALFWCGVLHEGAGDDDRARQRLEQALERFTADRDERGIARALNSLGVVARSQDDLERASELLTRALELDRANDNKQGIAISLNNLGIVEVDRGRYAEAATLLEEAVELDRAAGSRVGAAYSELAYGSAIGGLDRLDEAADAIGTAIETFAELEDAEGVADGLDELGELAMQRAAADTAFRLFAAASALRERTNVRLRSVDRRRHEATIAAAADELDSGDATRIAAESRAIDLPAAVALARAGRRPTR